MTIGPLAVNLAAVEILSFDCYGTLIDWEAGLTEALQPLLARALNPPASVLEAFATAETAEQIARPSAPYSEILAAVHACLARAWRAAPDRSADRAFADSVAAWPAFSDTVSALRRLERLYRLVILSNVDRALFASTLPKLGVTFHAVYTAEEIGCYKPDPRTFDYLIGKLNDQGVPTDRVLHVAQSLHHDHIPAKQAGLATVWIDRRAGFPGGATPSPASPVQPDLRYATLAEFAAACEAARTR